MPFSLQVGHCGKPEAGLGEPLAFKQGLFCIAFLCNVRPGLICTSKPAGSALGTQGKWFTAFRARSCVCSIQLTLAPPWKAAGARAERGSQGDCCDATRGVCEAEAGGGSGPGFGLWGGGR